MSGKREDGPMNTAGRFNEPSRDRFARVVIEAL